MVREVRGGWRARGDQGGGRPSGGEAPVPMDGKAKRGWVQVGGEHVWNFKQGEDTSLSANV